MLANLGHKVMSLTRIAVGPISLKGLAAGEYRPLSAVEVGLLRKVAAGIPVASPRSFDRDRPRPATRGAARASSGTGTSTGTGTGMRPGPRAGGGPPQRRAADGPAPRGPQRAPQRPPAGGPGPSRPTACAPAPLRQWPGPSWPAACAREPRRPAWPFSRRSPPCRCRSSPCGCRPSPCGCRPSPCGCRPSALRVPTVALRVPTVALRVPTVALRVRIVARLPWGLPATGRSSRPASPPHSVRGLPRPPRPDSGPVSGSDSGSDSQSGAEAKDHRSRIPVLAPLDRVVPAPLDRVVPAEGCADPCPSAALILAPGKGRDVRDPGRMRASDRSRPDRTSPSGECGLPPSGRRPHFHHWAFGSGRRG